MIKDIKVIKEHLKGCSEIEIPYPFKNDVHIKYITMKEGEESFYPGGKYVKLLNGKILLCNNGKSWSVPINIKNKEGDIVYKTRFFVVSSFEKDKESTEVTELKSIIKSQQDIIEKISKSLKIKSEENEQMKMILQKIRDKNI
jgi:hypothetical protein